MKTMIEVPNEHINGALAEPASRYWASEASWNPGAQCGFVVETEGLLGKPKKHLLTAGRLEDALSDLAKLRPKQFARLMAGDYDADTGDVLLQLAALGEVRYG